MYRLVCFPRFAPTPHSPGQQSARFLKRAALVLLPLLGAISPLKAQGTIAGIVVEHNQTPLPSAAVTVRGTSLGTITDANGRFRISGISVPTVVLEVRRLGYRMAAVTAIKLGSACS